MRVNLISSIWGNATLPTTSYFPPEENGWKLENNQFIINWYDGPETPRQIEDITIPEDDSENEFINTSELSYDSDPDLSDNSNLSD